MEEGVELGLAGKSAIVTGGSGVIGQGLVLEFAREGVNVISASRDMVKGAELMKQAEDLGLPGKVLAVQTDVTDRASIDRMIARCHEAFGPVDILVNNAGGAQRPVAFEALDDDTLKWDLALNAEAVVYCCQAAGKDMLERGGGVIVNISSNGALLSEAANNLVSYGAAKGYVNVLTKALAGEWAKRGIRVNTICPGWIVPEKEEEAGEGSLWRRFGFDLIGKPDDMQKALEDGTLYNMSSLPIPRLGRPKDVAYLALFLASDVSSYVTGQMISVSGGAWMY
jgi:NAD(P)-dependent dehydrogenase (short-subunit alcohol dehydrogenase family)